mgnify:CR=1 FL=1
MSKKILIVEDDGNIRELLRLYLEREGYEITEAANGEEGVELWRKINPDMILLDVMMPIMDGWQVCKIIRKESKVPIIIMTAKCSKTKLSQLSVMVFRDQVRLATCAIMVST